MGAPSPKKGKRDANALIAGRKKAERSIPICMRADLRRQMGDLSRELTEAEAERATSGSLASGSRSRDLAEQLSALHDEMVESIVDFKLRAMPRGDWRRLAIENPPRDGVESDKRWGVNEDAFFEAAIRASCYEPELTEESWAEFFSDCSDAEWGALRDAVRMINDSDIDAPFSRTALRILQAFEPS